MKRNHYVFVAMVAVVALSMFFSMEKKTIAGPGMNEKPVLSEAKEDSVKTVAAAQRRPLISITPKELKNMRETLPDMEKVKDEVTADPHRTPPSLLNFAKSMSPLMEKALKDDHDAAILINALRDCALNESSAHAARVLCVTNSERLGETFKELQGKASEMRAKVDPKVRKVLERQDALKK